MLTDIIVVDKCIYIDFGADRVNITEIYCSPLPFDDSEQLALTIG